MELLLFFFFVPMRNDLDGSPQKTIGFAELVFQVAQIGKMEQFRIVYMQDKGGRIHPDLRAIVDFQLPPGVRWSGMGILGIP